MPAKQGNSRNKLKIKRLTTYALMTAFCLIIGYIEGVLSLSLTVLMPGVKLGLSNAMALTLVCVGDKKGAVAVNITRILLSALLFGSPISLVFSLSGGISSLAVICILSRLKSVSELGMSIASGATHNVFQCIAAIIFVGAGTIYYMPLLIAIGAACGVVCGTLAKLIIKKVKTNAIF